MPDDGERDEPPLTLAERRLRDLLTTLAGEEVPHEPALAHRVVRSARRQRAARSVLLVAGRLAAAVGEGLGLLARAGRSDGSSR